MTAYYQARVGHQWMAILRQVQPTLDIYAAALASTIREAFASLAIYRNLAPANPRAVRCALRYGKLVEISSRPELFGSKQIRADIIASRKPGIAVFTYAIRCKCQKKRSAATAVSTQLLNSTNKN